MPAAKAKAKKEKVIEIPALKPGILIIELIGDSSLVSHRWSEKAKKEMLDKQMKKPKAAKTAKDPIDDFVQSLYIIDEQPGDRQRIYDSVKEENGDNLDGLRFGMPSTAFKNAAVSACRQVDGIAMTEARGCFHVNLGEDLVEIIGKPAMREDMVRISNGVADIRYRGEFKEWRAEIRVKYNPGLLSEPQIVNLFNTAGFSVGIGEARPERNGAWGMFHVATQVDAEEESTPEAKVA